MKLKTNKAENNLIIYLSGRIDVHLASEIEEDINKLIKDITEKNVILNLQEVEYMSSSGLRVFVSLMRNLKENDCRLKLSNLSTAVYKIFEVVELMDMFDIYSTEKEALAAG